MPATDWPTVLAVGVFAQCGQFRFLNAHKLAEAGLVAVLGYLSVVLSTTVDYLFFDEVPSLAFWIGAAMIVAATLAVSAAPMRALHAGSLKRPRA